MSLGPGTKFSHYEIRSLLGVGGMGEVYRARDTRLGRDVALKVLSASLASDPERLRLLEREARVLATLNHPHIAAIYGIEDAAPVRALVLELVEGLTLADRLDADPLKMDETLKLARQIVDALDAAHERGIVHRDLKPANIKITPEGVVKVLDFGIAKVLQTHSETNAESPDATMHRTELGTVLGTLAYMSPEQARGLPVDKRTDIWAFGCVLYEMLSGRVAFSGATPADTVAAIVGGEPDWSALPAHTPLSLRRLVEHCLAKEPRHRLRDIGDARIALATNVASLDNAPTSGSRWVWLATSGVAAALGAVAAVALWPHPEPSVVPATRLTIPLSSTDVFSGHGRGTVSVSRDGRMVAFAANQQIYVRSLDQLEARPLAGTEPSAAPAQGRDERQATTPVFSPDGQWIAFVENGALKKVPVGGGNAIEIFRGPINTASWSEDNSLVFGMGGRGGVWRVSANGGEATSLVAVERGQRIESPSVLPGGKEILFTLSSGEHWEEADVVIQALETGARHVVVHGAASARYLESGHLVYGSERKLLAVRFDQAAHRTVGAAVPVVSDVAQETAAGSSGSFQYAVSDSGTLVYIPESAVAIRRQLVWVDRQGRQEPLPAEPRAYEYPRISPDGRRVALDLRDRENDAWIWDFASSTLTRSTFGRHAGGPAIWTRDGQRIVFAPDIDGNINLFSTAANSAGGTAERLVTSPNMQLADVVTPDGRGVLFTEFDPATRADIHLLDTGAGKSRPVLNTRFNEMNPDVAPDGRWLAYQSDESGREEVYVRPFPDVAADRFQITGSGGTRPLWSRDGRELFYLDADRRLTVVPVLEQKGFGTGPAKTLFPTEPFGREGIGRNFDVSPDGSRFLLVNNLGSLPDARRVVVVLNWADELKRRIP